jgi:hypothetical protein
MLSVISIKCFKYHLENVKGVSSFPAKKDERKAQRVSLLM